MISAQKEMIAKREGELKKIDIVLDELRERIRCAQACGATDDDLMRLTTKRDMIIQYDRDRIGYEIAQIENDIAFQNFREEEWVRQYLIGK